MHLVFVSGHIINTKGRSDLCDFPIIAEEALTCDQVAPLMYINVDDMDSLAVLALDATAGEDYVVIDHLKW